MLIVVTIAAAALATSASVAPVALTTVVVAAGGLGWLFVRQARTAARLRHTAAHLRDLNASLAAQVESGAADVRDSHARLRSVIDSAVDGIIVIDDRGLIESFNPGAERLFGYAEAEVRGRNVNVLMPAPYQEEHDAYISRYLQTGQAKIIGTGREVSGLRRDGTTFPLHLSVGEHRIGDARKFTGIVHDLTNRVRIEEQLRERVALAKLGEMAAVIAHEVRNPLAGVRAAIQVVGGRFPASSPDSSIMREIVSRIDSLDNLINDLLLFARPPQPRLASVDLASLVGLTAELACRDPLIVGVRVEITGAAPLIRADPGLLTIVFQNLLLNAAQAMQGSGTVRVSLGTADDGMARVEFNDTGPGIPPEVRDKVFTAFFTTKARGSGLGLATARRLVEAHQGQIAIDVAAGEGTTVVVRLPIEPP